MLNNWNNDISGWWFGTWILFSHHIGNVIFPTDFHSIIFQRGRLNQQPEDHDHDLCCLNDPSSQQCVCHWFHCDSQLVAQERVLYHAFRLLVLKMLGFTMRRACDRCSFFQDVGRIKPQRDAPDTIKIYEIRFFATHIQVFDGFCGLQKAIFWGLRTTSLSFGVCEPGALHWGGWTVSVG